jgi:hypothetical protein
MRHYSSVRESDVYQPKIRFGHLVQFFDLGFGWAFLLAAQNIRNGFLRGFSFAPLPF